MLNKQLNYYALQIIGFDTALMQMLGMNCVHAELAHAGRSTSIYIAGRRTDGIKEIPLVPKKPV
jgi:hypothetical protein